MTRGRHWRGQSVSEGCMMSRGRPRGPLQRLDPREAGSPTAEVGGDGLQAGPPRSPLFFLRRGLCPRAGRTQPDRILSVAAETSVKASSSG